MLIYDNIANFFHHFEPIFASQLAFWYDLMYVRTCQITFIFLSYRISLDLIQLFIDNLFTLRYKILMAHHIQLLISNLTHTFLNRNLTTLLCFFHLGLIWLLVPEYLTRLVSFLLSNDSLRPLIDDAFSVDVIIDHICSYWFLFVEDVAWDLVVFRELLGRFNVWLLHV